MTKLLGVEDYYREKVGGIMTKICSNCGKRNSEKDKFCGECGSSLTESTEITKPKVENRGYLVCSKCGGSYKLKEGESPDDFDSCECGGKLKFKKNLNSQKVTDTAKDLKDTTSGLFSKLSFKGKAILGLGGIIVIALIFVAVSGMFSVAGNEFENDYVKFKVPNGLNVTDRSTSSTIDIVIFNGTKSIGSIQTGSMMSDVWDIGIKDTGDLKKISISGKEAVEKIMKDGTAYAFIHTSDGGSGAGSASKSINYIGVDLNFDDQQVYYTVKNSLVIKKNPKDQP